MALYKYPGSSRQPVPPAGITEFEILKASHRFLRDEDERPTTWDEKLAGKYYSNLYREFAVCDLKHYKSGNFALRWRTEEEVLDGSGETTCGNTRCERHFPSPRRQVQASNSKERADADDQPPGSSLTTLELPFAYFERGESKSALVKVVLCGRCVKKLMWKRTKEKEREVEVGKGEGKKGKERTLDEDEDVQVKDEPRSSDDGQNLEVKRKVKADERKKKRMRGEEEDESSRASRRRRRSRSGSPRRRSKERSHAR